MSSPVAAQQRGDERYEERKRFPLVRKVFRKIRGDVRYHVGALRETASGIGHDVKSTIRGEGPPRGASQNQYGYRSVPQPPRPDDTPRRGRDFYEEPARPQYPVTPPPAQSGAARPPGAAPGVVKPQSKPGAYPYRTVPANPGSDDPLNEVPELEPLPDTDTEAGAGHSTGSAAPPTPSKEKRAQAEQPQKPGSKPKPVVGKVEYPEAKRSNRPGFHYSPYAPYELLDTRGIKPGGLAKDPGNGNIFRLPK